MEPLFEVEVVIESLGVELRATARGSRGERPPPHSVGASITIERLEAFSQQVQRAVRTRRPLEGEVLDEARALRSALIAGGIRDLVTRMEEASKGSFVVHRLVLSDRNLQAIPWEAMGDPATTAGFWGTDPHVQLLRGVTTPDAWAPRDVRGPVRILAIAPNSGELSLNLLRTTLAESIAAGEIEWLNPITQAMASKRTIFDAIRRSKTPHIIHFLGHAGMDPNGNPILRLADDDDGEETWLQVQVFADELKACFAGDLRLVQLEACEGAQPGAFGSAAEIFARAGADAVIAHLWPVRADVAHACSQAFYRALTSRNQKSGDVARSLHDARRTILSRFHGSAEAFSPVLYLRAPHPAFFDFQRRFAPTRTGAAKIGDREQRTRIGILQRVRHDWIEGLLDKGPIYQHAARITPTLETVPSALADVWKSVVDRPDPMAERLPAGKTLGHVFDESLGSLLILGDPGAGKTTQMLELARMLLDRAEQDEQQPVPVVFHLAPWAGKPLDSWLVDELKERYNLSPKFGKPLVEADAILPLLDGLDEVPEEKRKACAEAINDFRRAHGTTPLVVCCRRADYNALGTKLVLDAAVVILPFEDAQVDECLATADGALAGLREALVVDADLREMARTPLMLGVMAVAYQGASAAAIPMDGSIEQRRRRILDAYVQHALGRRSSRKTYAPQETIHWLSWLARSLSKQSTTIFHIGQLQPEWLPSRALQWVYTLVDRLGFGLVAVFVWCATTDILVKRFGMGDEVRLEELLFLLGTVALLGGARERSRRRIIVDATTGTVVAVLFFHVVMSGSEAYATPSVAVLFIGANIGGFLGGIAGGPGIRPRAIIMAEMVRWHFAGAWRGARITLFLGGFILLVLTVVLSQVGIISDGVVWGIRFAGIGFPLIAYYAGFARGEIEHKTRPNQGFRSSLWNGLLMGVIGPMVPCVVMTAFAWFAFLTSVEDALKVLNVWVFLSLPSGLAFGGYACLSHIALRIVLRAAGFVPIRYATFLDHCVERVLMRRIGGSYVFIHRLVQEHFASLGISR